MTLFYFYFFNKEKLGFDDIIFVERLKNKPSDFNSKEILSHSKFIPYQALKCIKVQNFKVPHWHSP